MIVTGKRVSAFVASRNKTTFHPPYAAIGRDRDGKIVAGAVFNCWTGSDCEISIATEPDGMSRALLRAWGDYVMHKLQCQRVSITTEQPHVVDLAVRLGGQVEGKKRHAFGYGRDGWIVGIVRHEWKFR